MGYERSLGGQFEIPYLAFLGGYYIRGVFFDAMNIAYEAKIYKVKKSQVGDFNLHTKSFPMIHGTTPCLQLWVTCNFDLISQGHTVIGARALGV